MSARRALVFVEVGKGSSNLLREILTAKYGEGDRVGIKSNFSETWRGETATAIYYYYSDENPDLYKRKTREVVEISQTGRDVQGDLQDYLSRVKAEEESKREESLRNIW